MAIAVYCVCNAAGGELSQRRQCIGGRQRLQVILKGRQPKQLSPGALWWRLMQEVERQPLLQYLVSNLPCRGQLAAHIARLLQARLAILVHQGVTWPGIKAEGRSPFQYTDVGDATDI